MAVARRGATGDDPHGTSPLGGKVLQGGSLAITVFRDGQDGTTGLDHQHSDDPLTLAQLDAAHAMSATAHGTDLALAEADGLAGGAEQEDVLLTVSDGYVHQVLAFVQVQGDDAAGQGPGKLRQGGLFYRPGAGRHEDEVPFVIFLDRQDGMDALPLTQGQEVDHRSAPRRRPGLRQFVDFEPVDLAQAGEAQDRVVGMGDEEFVDEILVLGPRRRAPLAAALLGLILAQGLRLDITGVGQGDHHVLGGDEVLQGEIGVIRLDLGAAGIPVLVADGDQFIANHRHEALGGGEDIQEFGDGGQDLLVFLEDLVLFQAGQAMQAQVEDGLGLGLAQPIARRAQSQSGLQIVGATLVGPGPRQHVRDRPGPPDPGQEADLGVRRAGGGLDERDDLVDIGQGHRQAFEDVGPPPGLAQFEDGPAGHHVPPMAQEILQQLLEVEQARLAVHQGDHVDAKNRLQRGVQEEVVQHHVRIMVALDLDDHAHAVLVRLVAQLGDALDLLLLDQFRHTLQQAGLVHLIG